MVKILISIAWMITISLNTDDGRRLAPVHRLAEHLVQARRRRPPVARARCSRSWSTASRSTSRTSRTSTRTPRSASARSRTSPGRACSTSPPAPSAAAASPSARPGTPTSRCRPKLLMMGLRDHAYAKAPYLLAAEDRRAESLPEAAHGRGASGRWSARPGRPHGRRRGHRPGRAVVLHARCGACVQQCPVDIEHVDHIMDMRRYQVLIESAFPSELNGLFKGLENKGNPWGMARARRLDWAKDLPFEVQVGRRRTSRTWPRSSTCSGSAAPGPTRTGPRRPPGRSPSCCTRPASVRRARRRRDLHRRPGPPGRQRVRVPAAGDGRTPRRSTRPRRPRSSPPARTASTR